jgi:phage terminase large subunit
MAHINDRATLDEMLTFVRNAKGRPEAQNGAHDDCIMALAIALHARLQMEDADVLDAVDMSRWTADMMEDYDNADDAGKAYLRKKWGKR